MLRRYRRGVTSADVEADVFLEHRGALFGLAYRMLGSVCDAEDVVSDTYLRWQGARTAGTYIENPKSYLFAVTARLSIDQLRSARRTRVDYIGTWLPEPLVTDWTCEPEVRAELTDTLSLGLLRVLEVLSPVERAIFVLREAFDYPHDETARLLDLTSASVRQHYRRARQRLASEGAPRFIAPREKQDELTQRFVAAVETGEVQPLADLLVTDAVLYADGGGKASSIRQPAHGHLRIARFIRGLVRHSPPDTRVDLVRANGAPAMLVRSSTEVLGIYALEVDPARELISAVHAVRNPDKLQALSVA
jgi:RNA polymerase sigma-70 factor, ECF subfamily